MAKIDKPLEYSTNHFGCIDTDMIKSEHRGYLGLSGVGHSCNRYIWYSFHHAYDNYISKRIRRLFDRGHWEEERVINDLLYHGLSSYGAQSEITMHDDHVKGHVDEIVGDVPTKETEDHVLEIKTMNINNFGKLLKHGIKAFPSYLMQVNMYMDGMNLKNYLFVATNKNDESRHFIRGDLDQEIVDFGHKKIFDVLSAKSDNDLTKIGSPTWHECKFCPAIDVCHNGKPMNKNCRTCSYSTLEEKGQWGCSYDDHMLIDTKICANYEAI